MEVRKYRQLVTIHKLPSKESTNAYFANNPEESATSSLLELSNDFLLNNPFEHQPIQQFAKKKDTKDSFGKIGEQKKAKIYQGRLSVADNFTQCHKMSRKVSSNCISNVQTEAIFKRSALNPSHFLLFENGKLKNLQAIDFTNANVVEPAQKALHHYKGLKNVTAFIRRRKNSEPKHKQQAKRCELQTANSTQIKRNDESRIIRQKMVKSCELIDCTKQIIPLKIVAPSKREEIPNIELRCTSPNFKYKRFLNYRKIFANNQDRNNRQS